MSLVYNCRRAVKRDERRPMRSFTVLLLVLASGLMLSASQGDCTYLNSPDDFKDNTARIHKSHSNLTVQVAAYTMNVQPAAYAATVDAKSIPHKNFIDNYIFSRMAAAGIQSAPLTSDTEFLRRLTLDLTSRIPAGADVDTFANDSNTSKRDQK